MSAEEFAEWSVMFTAEELHPSAGRIRHAQLMAALHNGPLVRRGKKMWSAAEFIADSWAEPKPAPQVTPAAVAAQVAAFNASRRSRGRK